MLVYNDYKIDDASRPRAVSHFEAVPEGFSEESPAEYDMPLTCTVEKDRMVLWVLLAALGLVVVYSHVTS